MVLEITDLTVEGFGVAKQSGLVYFVKGHRGSWRRGKSSGCVSTEKLRGS